MEQDKALVQFRKGQAMGHRVLESSGVPAGSKLPTWKFEGGTPTWPLQLVWRPAKGSGERPAPVAKFPDLPGDRGQETALGFVDVVRMVSWNTGNVKAGDIRRETLD